MTHLSWLIDEQVLKLTFPDILKEDFAKVINDEITEILDKNEQKVIIYIDAADLTPSYQTTDVLRSTQTYIGHKNLDCLLVVTANKLNRLIILMAYAAARVPVLRLENKDELKSYLDRRGIVSESSCCD